MKNHVNLLRCLYLMINEPRICSSTPFIEVRYGIMIDGRLALRSCQKSYFIIPKVNRMITATKDKQPT